MEGLGKWHFPVGFQDAPIIHLNLKPPDHPPLPYWKHLPSLGLSPRSPALDQTVPTLSLSPEFHKRCCPAPLLGMDYSVCARSPVPKHVDRSPRVGTHLALMTDFTLATTLDFFSRTHFLLSPLWASSSRVSANGILYTVIFFTSFSHFLPYVCPQEFPFFFYSFPNSLLVWQYLDLDGSCRSRSNHL